MFDVLHAVRKGNCPQTNLPNKPPMPLATLAKQWIANGNHLALLKTPLLNAESYVLAKANLLTFGTVGFHAMQHYLDDTFAF